MNEFEQKLIDTMVKSGWQMVDNKVVYVDDPDMRPKFDSWSDAIIACIQIASEE